MEIKGDELDKQEKQDSKKQQMMKMAGVDIKLCKTAG